MCNERASERATGYGLLVMGDDERRAMDRSWPRSGGGGGQLRKGGVLVPGASRARSALFQLMNRPFRGGKDVTSKVLRPGLRSAIPV